jgi:hypothetical protein
MTIHNQLGIWRSPLQDSFAHPSQLLGGLSPPMSGASRAACRSAPTSRSSVLPKCFQRGDPLSRIACVASDGRPRPTSCPPPRPLRPIAPSSVRGLSGRRVPGIARQARADRLDGSRRRGTRRCRSPSTTAPRLRGGARLGPSRAGTGAGPARLPRPNPSCANSRQERRPQAAPGHDQAEVGWWSRRSWRRHATQPRFVGVGAPADPARWEASGTVGPARLGTALSAARSASGRSVISSSSPAGADPSAAMTRSPR